jgi:stage II sporulation protein AA (anti-sigma F factor antagonist)
MPPKPDLTPRPRAEFVCDTAGSILSIRIRGEIDHHTAAAIRQGIDATLFEKRPQTLILDLSAVGFMDSSGLGLIMGRYSVMKELGGDMTVWNPSPETRTILTLAGMERLVRIEYPKNGEDSAQGGRASARIGKDSARHGRASTPSSKAPAPSEGPNRTTPRPVAPPSRGGRASSAPRTSPRRRKKNGLVYETEPRKEKNA